jgi:hypothetical protein
MKINIVGIDPAGDYWGRLYDLLEKEVQQKTLTYAICTYDRSVSDEVIADCDGIIFLEMHPTKTDKPFIRLDEGDPFDEKLKGLLVILQRTDPAFATIADDTGRSKPEEKRSRTAAVFISLLLTASLIAIGFNAYLMVKMTRAQKEATNPFPEQPRDIALCMGNIAEYQLFFKGQVPKPELACPASGEPYLISSAGGVRTISCPAPHRHEPPLKGLRASGETSPEVIK